MNLNYESTQFKCAIYNIETGYLKVDDNDNISWTKEYNIDDLHKFSIKVENKNLIIKYGDSYLSYNENLFSISNNSLEFTFENLKFYCDHKTFYLCYKYSVNFMSILGFSDMENNIHCCLTYDDNLIVDLNKKSIFSCKLLKFIKQDQILQPLLKYFKLK